MLLAGLIGCDCYCRSRKEEYKAQGQHTKRKGKNDHISNRKTRTLLVAQWIGSEMKSLSRVPLFATPWTVAYYVSPSMGFSRQESWSGLPFPFPGDLPNPGTEPGSPALQPDTSLSGPQGSCVSASPVEAWVSNELLQGQGFWVQ